MRSQFLTALGIAFLAVAAAPALAQELAIHCLNIGHGDCTLIISPTGETMMVDTGPDRIASQTHLCTYLDYIGIDSLNYLIISHYDMYNIGGVDTLIKHGIKIDRVYDRGWGHCSKLFADTYLPVISSMRESIANGQEFDLGGGINVRVVSVNGNGELIEPFIDRDCDGPDADDENDYCVALVVTYGCFEFFVGGDLSGSNDGGYTDIETSVAPEATDIDVYRVNNQGSKYSTNEALLDSLRPKVSILSVGSNSYHHPDTAVVRRLQEAGAVYQTADASGNDIHGDIVIRTTGENTFTVNDDSYSCLPQCPECGNGIFEDQPGSMPNFVLYPNYPNPFNARTTIRYDVPQICLVDLAIYDILGRKVRTLVNEIQTPGRRSIVWDGKDQAGRIIGSGIYFCHFALRNQSQTRKMLMIR